MDSMEPLLASLGYRDVMVIGNGSFGAVFRAIDPRGQMVALKVATTPHGRRAAMREIEAMSSIPPHPNCLELISWESRDPYTIVCTKLAHGGDTLQLMRNRGLIPLPEADARHLFTQLIEGLRHIHACGLVHQDVKCENLLLTGPRDRQLVIGDFGFASKWAPGATLGEWRGSLHYSAPEVLLRRPYEGPAVDVWSAGVVLYAWSTARLPFGGEREEDVKAAILSGAYTLPPALSAPLRDLIERMLDPNPARRPALTEILAHEWLREGSNAPASSVPRHASAATLSHKLEAASVPPMQRTNSAPQSGKGHFLKRLSRVLVRKGS